MEAIGRLYFIGFYSYEMSLMVCKLMMFQYKLK